MTAFPEDTQALVLRSSPAMYLHRSDSDISALVVASFNVFISMCMLTDCATIEERIAALMAAQAFWSLAFLRTSIVESVEPLRCC